MRFFCTMTSIVTSLFWNKDFSIYLSPWDILNLSDGNIYIDLLLVFLFLQYLFSYFKDSKEQRLSDILQNTESIP